MITIAEFESPSNLAADMFFDRTERLRSKISECSREELLDLVTHLINKAEVAQSKLENLSQEFEEMLGYHDPLILKH